MGMKSGLLRPLGFGLGATIVVVALVSLVGLVLDWTTQSVEAISALPLLVIALVLLGFAYRGPNAPRIHTGPYTTAADAYSFEHQYYEQQKVRDRQPRHQNRRGASGLNHQMLAAALLPLLAGLILMSASLH